VAKSDHLGILEETLDFFFVEIKVIFKLIIEKFNKNIFWTREISKFWRLHNLVFFRQEVQSRIEMDVELCCCLIHTSGNVE
jgi:hypothetical protein